MFPRNLNPSSAQEIKESEMIEDLGVRNPAAGLALCGLSDTGLVRYNFGEADLVELALARGKPA